MAQAQRPPDLDEQGNPILDKPPDLDEQGNPVIAPSGQVQVPANFAIVNKENIPQENGFGPLNDIIRPRIQQLAGQKQGPLNSNPNLHFLMNYPLPGFREDIQKPEGYEDPRHWLGRNVYNIGRHLISPLNIAGMKYFDVPQEPIPNPADAGFFRRIRGLLPSF